MVLFHSFLWLSSIPSRIYPYPHLRYPVICDGHLGSFLVLGIVNSADMNEHRGARYMIFLLNLLIFMTVSRFIESLL